MIFFRVLRNVAYNRPFLQHPRILAFDFQFATDKDVVNEILNILDIESAAKNHKVVKQGIEQLNLVMGGLDINDKKKLIPVFVHYGKWFSSLRQVDGSLECYNLALKIFKDQPGDFEEDRVVITLSQVNEILKLKNFQQCEKLLDDLKSICDKMPENLLKGKYLETTGKVKILVGKQEEAINLFENAKVLFLQLEAEPETKFHLIISTNYLSMLYSVKGDENFDPNFQLATRFLSEFQENDKERIIECLEIWTRNINFVENEEKFYEYFFSIESMLENYSPDFTLFFYENVIKCSAVFGKTSDFIGPVYENYVKFVEKEFSKDITTMESAYYICARKMMDYRNFEMAIEYALKCLEYRKKFRDIEGVIRVKNLMIEAYIENKQIFAAKLLIKEIEPIIKRLHNPGLEEQHRKILEKLNDLLKSY